jgi:hypothetical protein
MEQPKIRHGAKGRHLDQLAHCDPKLSSISPMCEMIGTVLAMGGFKWVAAVHSPQTRKGFESNDNYVPLRIPGVTLVMLLVIEAE